jgi:hypothetical protein
MPVQLPNSIVIKVGSVVEAAATVVSDSFDGHQAMGTAAGQSCAIG